MPKYLLLKHYSGGPEPHHPFPPMDQWAPEEVEAHMAFLHQVKALLQENGEYVDGQALTQAQTWVRYGGPDAAPVRAGPRPPRRPPASAVDGLLQFRAGAELRRRFRGDLH